MPDTSAATEYIDGLFYGGSAQTTEAYNQWGSSSAPYYTFVECLERCTAFGHDENSASACRSVVWTHGVQSNSHCLTSWASYPHGQDSQGRGHCILYVQYGNQNGMRVQSETQCVDGSYRHAAPNVAVSG
eukprot:75832-Prymnesium_polylepis.2